METMQFYYELLDYKGNKSSLINVENDFCKNELIKIITHVLHEGVYTWKYTVYRHNYLNLLKLRLNLYYAEYDFSEFDLCYKYL